MNQLKIVKAHYEDDEVKYRVVEYDKDGVYQLRDVGLFPTEEKAIYYVKLRQQTAREHNQGL